MSFAVSALYWFYPSCLCATVKGIEGERGVMLRIVVPLPFSKHGCDSSYGIPNDSYIVCD